MISREFGRLVSEKRRQAHPPVGQEVLARALGVSRGSVSNIENGRHRVFLDQVLIIAGVLKVPVAELVPHVAEGDFAVVDTPSGADIRVPQSELREVARAALRQAVSKDRRTRRSR